MSFLSGFLLSYQTTIDPTIMWLTEGNNERRSMRCQEHESTRK